jgi:hypothetical protein
LKPNKWTPEYVLEKLTEMLNTLIGEDKKGDLVTLFLKELYIKTGINRYVWDNKVMPKYNKEEWFNELWFEIKDRLHIRLYKLGIQDPKLTGLVIWLGKCNYGDKETDSSVNKIEVELNVKEIK